MSEHQFHGLFYYYSIVYHLWFRICLLKLLQELTLSEILRIYSSISISAADITITKLHACFVEFTCSGLQDPIQETWRKKKQKAACVLLSKTQIETAEIWLQ